VLHAANAAAPQVRDLLAPNPEQGVNLEIRLSVHPFSGLKSWHVPDATSVEVRSTKDVLRTMKQVLIPEVLMCESFAYQDALLVKILMRSSVNYPDKLDVFHTEIPMCRCCIQTTRI
jgi:hypothetical protein